MIENKIYSIINNDSGIITMNKVNKYGIMAFVSDDDKIVLISDDEFGNGIITNDENTIYIYECLKNNNCKKTSGYIRNTDYVFMCTDNTSETIDINECSRNNIGKAYIDEDSKFQLCVSTDGTNIQSINISDEVGKEKYIFTAVNENSQIYNLYISNINGYVIGLSTTSIYLF